MNPKPRGVSLRTLSMCFARALSVVCANKAWSSCLAIDYLYLNSEPGEPSIDGEVRRYSAADGSYDAGAVGTGSGAWLNYATNERANWGFTMYASPGDNLMPGPYNGASTVFDRKGPYLSVVGTHVGSREPCKLGQLGPICGVKCSESLSRLR